MLLMSLFYIELKNLSSYFLIIISLCNAPVPLASKYAKSMMLLPPCLTAGKVSLGLKPPTLFLQACFLSGPDSSVLFSL